MSSMRFSHKNKGSLQVPEERTEDVKTVKRGGEEREAALRNRKKGGEERQP